MSASLDAPADGLGRRCCATHTDWPTLAQHLLDEFPDATIADVVRQIRRARDAVRGLGMDDEDGLAVGEAIVRNQLSLLTGRVDDVARLDPERHRRADSAGAA